jgi:hypothetical protein
MEDLGVPPGFSPPFATVTGNDRTAWVVITIILRLIYSLLFGLVRKFVSWTTGRGLLHSDDVALGISTASQVYLTTIARSVKMRDHGYSLSSGPCDSAVLRYPGSMLYGLR